MNKADKQILIPIWHLLSKSLKEIDMATVLEDNDIREEDREY